jgi:hypothetical protein
MADSPVEKRKWSLKKKLLLGFVAPLLVLLAVLLVLDGLAKGKLNAAMREARAVGGPVTFEELMAARKVWPDQQNGANVILKIKGRLDELGKNDKELESLPGFGFKDDMPLGRRLPAERDEAAGKTLGRLQPELSQIDQLLRYSGGRFPLTIAPNPIDTLLPDLKPLRTSAKLKAAQAQYRAMHGDTVHVVDDCRTILLHGQLLADEPLMISACLRIACEGWAVDTVQRVCALTTLSSEQLAELQKCLAATESPDRLSWGVRGERATFIQTGDWFRNQGEMPWPRGDPGGSDPPPRWVARLPGIRGLTTRDEAVGLRLYNRWVGVCQERRRALQADREIVAEADRVPIYCTLTKIMFPCLKQAFEFDGHTEAEIRSAVAGLAAERYRLDHGRFPEKLEDLVPQYLPRVPLDPFTDRALRLRNTDGVLMIYSVGEDLTDDGGALDGWVSKRPYRDWGFILLPPERRGLPASQPATEPEEDRTERINRFRYGTGGDGSGKVSK